MEYREGADVYNAQNEKVGEIKRVVLHPKKHTVTHIVVEKGFLFTTDKVISADMVAQADDDRVTLKSGMRDFEDLPDYTETHYVEIGQMDNYPDASGVTTPMYYYGPRASWWSYPGIYDATEPRYMNVEVRNIPDETIPLREGTDVISSDGENIGDIEEVITDESGERATHLLISQGLLFKDHKEIPTYWIDTVVNDKVHLSVDSATLRSLPKHENNPV
jgi:uncharacterized protein YrrD